MPVGTCALALVLLALLSGPAGSLQAQEAHPDDAAILLKLRQAMQASAAGFTRNWAQKDNPCAWDHIICQQGHVTDLTLWDNDACNKADLDPPYRLPAGLLARQPGGAGQGAPDQASEPPPPPVLGPLLPELARLPRLHTLQWNCLGRGIEGGFPEAWTQPGAFPSLELLEIDAAYMTGGLPDMHPGALPRLQELTFRVRSLESLPPPSWSAAGALPALRYLDMWYIPSEPLPPGLAAGWPRLERLRLVSWLRDAWLAGLPLGELLAAQAARRLGSLPASWAEGFPGLKYLQLDGVAGGGPIPQPWADGFPHLQTLNLRLNQLTGTLPPQLLSSHPMLSELRLEQNQLSGPLPDAWGQPSLLKTLVLAHNNLSGPAFPPTWLEPDSMPALQSLTLDGNKCLGGALPANLSWPDLETLYFTGTAVEGSIPAEWCSAPFASTLQTIMVDGSDVDPTLPPCAAAAFTAGLKVAVKLPMLTRTHSPAASHTAAADPSPEPHAGQWLRLAPVAVAAAAVAALVAGALLWRRQGARQLPRGLLRPQSQHKYAEVARGRPDESSLLPEHAQPMDALRAQLIDATARGELEMQPLGALPQALTHRIHASKERRQQEEELGPGQGVMPAASPSPRSMGSLLAPASTNAGAVALQPAERQWRLATESLKVEADQLQFVVGADGRMRELGEGAHAVVYLALLQGRFLVAVKVLKLQPGAHSAPAWREVALLRRCVHPHICPLLGVALKGQLLLLVMQYMPGGSLFAALQSPDLRDELRWAARGHRIALDVADALAFLHRAGVMHADLKPSNVLLSAEQRAYIADLGVAQALGAASRSNLGCSHVYGAPEQLMGERCTLAADIYSLGVLLIALLTQESIGRRGEWRLPAAPDECPAAVAELIQECIRAQPRQRPSAEEVLRRLQAAAAADASNGPLLGG